MAISIAVHEAVAGLIPAASKPPAIRETLSHVRIVTIQTVARPTPSPRPVKIVHVVRVVPVHRTSIHIAARPARHAQRMVAHRVAFAMRYGSKPEWDVAGAGTGRHAGLRTGTADTSGAQGASSAAASGREPCGFVMFSDPHGSQYDPRSHGFYVDIRMSVHFADGSSQSLILDYPWYYPSEADNPWSNQNLKDPGFPMRFQSPPAGKTGAEPDLVRYVMAHSTADGMTLLRDCPGTSDATAPRPDRSSRS
ncbi:MAG TPA: hypothetical protein VGI19_06955 [Candidatus Cybelea sp.]